MIDHDVVCIYKNFGNSHELRYMLRSVAKNLPHRNVVISGDLPEWCTNVIHVPEVKYPWAVMGNRLLNAEAKWLAACESPEVSEDFYAFNDDFFIMKPVKVIHQYHRGMLPANDHNSIYQGILTKTGNMLRARGAGSTNYELHVPMPMNKKKRAAINYVLQEDFKRGNVFVMRSAYGNTYNVGGRPLEDVKNVEDFEQRNFLSTTSGKFNGGPIGEYIRKQFEEPCIYEKT